MTGRKFKAVTPSQVLDAINAGMSQRRAAEVLGCSLSQLRHASCLFGWSWHGQAGKGPNQACLPVYRNSVFEVRQ